MTVRLPLPLAFVLCCSTLAAQDERTVVSIPFNAREGDFTGIPVNHNYQGIVIPVSKDSTFKIVYSDSSVMEVVKKGKAISFAFKKNQIAASGQFTVAPCPLSIFDTRYDMDLNEWVVRKVEFFTAYRTGVWEIIEGAATRTLVSMPVRFEEPCK